MIFVDTGAFIARYIKADQFHAQSIEQWRRLAADNEQLFTSNFVINETITLLSRWAGTKYAAGTARILYASGALTIIRPVEEDETQAIHMLERSGQPGISFTDCVSMVLIERLRISNVFTFDNHFRRMGVQIVPD